MNNAKVTVTKAVADALSFLQNSWRNDSIVKAAMGDDAHHSDWIPYVKVLREDDELELDTLIRALYLGYTVEETNEDMLREFYSMLDQRPIPMQAIVRETLSILDIRIEGVNA